LTITQEKALEKAVSLSPQPATKGNGEDNLFKGYWLFGGDKTTNTIPLF